MTAELLLSMLIMGFALGLLHALDPDHLMTIASLSARAESNRETLRYAGLWALGHGGLLITMAAALHLVGWQFPELLSAIAERSVGLILIAVGASVLWLRHPPHGKGGLRRKAPFAIGIVHGMAGSATMLALIPVSLYRPEAGIIYAILFSLGVFAAMLGFGWTFGRGQEFLGDKLPRVRAAARLLLGIGAVGMGAYWLQAA